MSAPVSALPDLTAAEAAWRQSVYERRRQLGDDQAAAAQAADRAVAHARQAGAPAKPDLALVPTAQAERLGIELLALRRVAARIAEELTARHYELCWQIRQEFAAGEPGGRSCAMFLGSLGLDGAEGLRQAAAWEHARRHRRTRELAAREPERALAFVSSLIAGDPQGQLDLNEDPEVARVMTMPPKLMMREIRRLLQGRGGRDDGPAPETPQLPLAEPPAERAEALLRAAEQAVSDARHAALAALDEGLAGDGFRAQRMLRQADLIVGHIDQITGALHDLAGGDGSPA